MYSRNPRGRPPATATRNRIVDEAMRLFSERGYRNTSVSDIQAAAGLSPSSGGMYRHFRSKRAVLEAGIEREVVHLEALRLASQMLPGGLGDLRAEAEVLGRFILLELAAEREIVRILFREADQFPDLAAAALDRLVRPAYAQMSEWVGARLPHVDAEAVGAVLLGAIGQYRVVEALTGTPPGEVEDERFVQAWVSIVTALEEKR